MENCQGNEYIIAFIMEDCNPLPGKQLYLHMLYIGIYEIYFIYASII